jgi:hypothetical protein
MRDSANDPDANMLACLLEGAKSIFGFNRGFTVAKLIEKASSPVADIKDVLMEIAGDRDAVNAKKMGHWLLKREGRIIDGIRIKRAGQDRKKIAVWEVCGA